MPEVRLSRAFSFCDHFSQAWQTPDSLSLLLLEPEQFVYYYIFSYCTHHLPASLVLLPPVAPSSNTSSPQVYCFFFRPQHHPSLSLLPYPLFCDVRWNVFLFFLPFFSSVSAAGKEWKREHVLLEKKRGQWTCVSLKFLSLSSCKMRDEWKESRVLPLSFSKPLMLCPHFSYSFARKSSIRLPHQQLHPVSSPRREGAARDSLTLS